jgi:LDH2 family malate/lactate/ureidoglycolate dehydrogenase
LRGGKIYAARQLGRPIPADWVVDRQRRPTTDSELYLHHAALSPMGGHKGYGLAPMAEALSWVLTGAAATAQVSSRMFGDPSAPTGHGAAFLAVDVNAIVGSSEFADRVRALAPEIHDAPTAECEDRVLLPGKREWALRRRALAEGIDLPPDVTATLAPMAAELGLNSEWLDVTPPCGPPGDNAPA